MYTYVVCLVDVVLALVKHRLNLLDVSTLHELREHPETDHNALSQPHYYYYYYYYYY